MDSLDRILLDYDFKDTFPELPKLSKSAANGCALCSVLKDEFQKFPFGSGPAELSIREISYNMHKHSDLEQIDKSWLQNLSVYFKRKEMSKAEETLTYTYALDLAIQANPSGNYFIVPDSHAQLIRQVILARNDCL
jgi:hypothetical protein